jgi:hypothetical protein
VTRETFRKKSALRRGGWTVMYDEEGTVVEHVQMPMNRYHWIITDHLETRPIPGSAFHVEVVKKRGSTRALEEIFRNEDGDGCAAVFGELLGYVLDANCKAITTKEIWDNLHAGKMKGRMTDFCCLVGPRVFDGYRDVTVTCALFEHTMQYKVWTNVFGAKLAENERVDRHLRRRERHHVNSGQFTILGAYEEPWSDYAKRQPGADGLDRIGLFAKGVEEHFGPDPYCFCANNADHPLPVVQNVRFPDLTNRLPALPHGMNGKFEGYTNIALLGSYNYSSFMGKALEALGITREEQEVARNFLTWYQQMMRFMGRDPSKPGQFTVIAPTTRFGDWCKAAGLLPECKTGRLPYVDDKIVPPLPKPGRRKIEKTLEQIKAARERKNARERAKYHERKRRTRNEQDPDHHPGAGAGDVRQADARQQDFPSWPPPLQRAALVTRAGQVPIQERHR